jgi:PQQ-dependent catabolism-associated CXXCW motif protein
MRTLPAIAAALLLTAASPAPVPEPSGFWDGAMHGATPDSVKGATVVTTDEVAALRDRSHPILLDVSEEPKAPPSTSKDMPWMPTHRSIPGAVWLPGAGAGRIDSRFEAAFKSQIAALTHDDPGLPIVVFCHPNCWGSWNAAKRLVGLGRLHVYWYPEGIEGWQDKHGTQVVDEDPAWKAVRSAMLQ